MYKMISWSQIRRINPAESNEHDGISSKMLLLCDDSMVSPLMLIFNNILTTGVYPDMWKLANVTPIHKKASKQLTKTYRTISLLSICGKVFEKIVFEQAYTYFVSNNLITNNQSGFRSLDSIDLINDIHQSFDNRKTLETCYDHKWRKNRNEDIFCWRKKHKWRNVCAGELGVVVVCGVGWWCVAVGGDGGCGVCVGGGGGCRLWRCTRAHVCGCIRAVIFCKHTLVGGTLHFTESNKLSL